MAIMWHGGNKWEGEPEIRAAKRGRAEWGPGIYGTSNYFRASQYAKGGKVTRLVEFQPRLFLEQAAIGLTTLTQFVNEHAPRSKQTDILERLESAAARNLIGKREQLGDGAMVHAEVILNMWVNTDLAHGQRGPALSEFLSGMGIDAHSSRSMSFDGTPEHWSVVFNTETITRHDVIRSKDVDSELWYLPSPIETPGLTIATHLVNTLGMEDDEPSQSPTMRMG